MGEHPVKAKRYCTTLITPFNTPCELIPPGDGWEYRDSKVRRDGCLIIVWETELSRELCGCGDPNCRGAGFR